MNYNYLPENLEESKLEKPHSALLGLHHKNRGKEREILLLT
jgi:hypothetical protein